MITRSVTHGELAGVDWGLGTLQVTSGNEIANIIISGDFSIETTLYLETVLGPFIRVCYMISP